ncbi:MAG: hypothetical protein ACXIU7_11540 [Roseinatronobacter sp.]
MFQAQTRPAPDPRPALAPAHLRAFIHAHSLKPGRPDLLRYSPEEIAQALSRLPAPDIACCLALLPAGVQIPVVMRLDVELRTRLVQDHPEWHNAIPILCANQGISCATGQVAADDSGGPPSKAM